MDKKAIEDCAFDKGLKQGLKQGLNNATKSIVKKMKSSHVSIEEICKYTGLSRQEVEKL